MINSRPRSANIPYAAPNNEWLSGSLTHHTGQRSLYSIQVWPNKTEARFVCSLLHSSRRDETVQPHQASTLHLLCHFLSFPSRYTPNKKTAANVNYSLRRSILHANRRTGHEASSTSLYPMSHNHTIIILGPSRSLLQSDICSAWNTAAINHKYTFYHFTTQREDS